MAVNYKLPTPASVLAVPGVTLGYTEAHVRKPNRKDMLSPHSSPTHMSRACLRKIGSAPRQCWCVANI
jgi:hypothetical protein